MIKATLSTILLLLASISYVSRANACPFASYTINANGQCVKLDRLTSAKPSAPKSVKGVSLVNISLKKAASGYSIEGTLTNNSSGDRKVIFVTYAIMDGNRIMDKDQAFIGRTLRPGESYKFSDLAYNLEVIDRGLQNMTIVGSLDNDYVQLISY